VSVLDWGQTGAIVALAAASLFTSRSINKINETIRVMLTGNGRR
jgi:hypothetical protein